MVATVGRGRERVRIGSKRGGKGGGREGEHGYVALQNEGKGMMGLRADAPVCLCGRSMKLLWRLCW